MRELERRVVLSVLDRKWREHLYEMDYLQEGIGLRAMAQRDPLVEYQREGFDMFAAMMDGIKEESVGYLFNLEVQVEPAPRGASRRAAGEAGAATDGSGGPAPGSRSRKRIRTSSRRVSRRGAGRRSCSTPRRRSTATPAGSPSPPPPRATVTTIYADVPRNAPCPCGSGKKFKRCHGDPRMRTT